MNSTLCKNRSNYTERNILPRNPHLSAQPSPNRTIPRPAPTFPKPHYPSKSTISLPPLSKGGGLTARHKLSLCCVFTCDMSTFLIYQTFLPSRRRDCHTPTNLSIPTTFSKAPQPPRLALSPLPLNKRFVSFASALSLEKHYILASLVKGRWIDGKAQTVALLRFYLRYVHLFNLSNFSAVKTEGLPHHSFQNRTTPRKPPTPLPFNKRSACFASLRNFGRSTSGIHAHPRKWVRQE